MDPKCFTAKRKTNMKREKTTNTREKRKLAEDTIIVIMIQLITAEIIYHYCYNNSINTKYNGPDFTIDDILPSLL